MFLKNDSIYKIGLRTINGDIEIKPQEIIHILEDEMLDKSEYLVTVKEKEYEDYINNISNSPNSSDNILIGHPESCKPCYEDGKTPSNDDCLKCKDEKLKEQLAEANEDNSSDEEKDEEKDQKDEDPSNTNTEEIIAKLKQQWLEAKTPAEKAKITKQLKKIQNT